MQIRVLSSVVLLALSGLAMAKSPNDVLVKNKYAVITRADVEAEIGRIPEQQRARYTSDLKGLEQVINNVVMQKTLAGEAVANKLDQVSAIQAQMESAANLVLARAMLDRVVEKAKAEVATIDFVARAKESYKATPEKYMEKPTVRAEHVLIDTKTRSKEDAKKRADEVYAKAIAGTAFASLADEYSDDPSAKSNHGDLGFFDAGTMVKPFADAAFKLEKAGDIAKPVETSFGWHVIRLIDKKAGGQKPFDMVKDSIVAEMKEKYVSEARDAKLKSLTDPANNSVDQAMVESMVVKPAAPMEMKPTNDNKANNKAVSETKKPVAKKEAGKLPNAPVKKAPALKVVESSVTPKAAK